MGVETVEHIVSMLMLSTLIAAIGIFCIDTSTNNVVNYGFSFNYHNWEKIDTSSTILGIITTAAAIVAIGFSINHITFSRVFETYSSRSFRFFFEKKKLFNSFIALILIIIFSTMLLLMIKSLPDPLQFLFLIILVIGFIFSLGLFYVTFHQTFRLLNKFDIIDDLENIVIQEIESLGNEH